MEALARIVADIHAHKPDHIAMTGDAVNLALPSESRPRRRLDAHVGRSEGDVSFTPGNHDAYVTAAPCRIWPADLRAVDRGLSPSSPSAPARRGAALIGLNSGAATWPLLATGRLGPRRARRLRGALLKETQGPLPPASC